MPRTPPLNNRHPLSVSPCMQNPRRNVTKANRVCQLGVIVTRMHRHSRTHLKNDIFRPNISAGPRRLTGVAYVDAWTALGSLLESLGVATRGLRLHYCTSVTYGVLCTSASHRALGGCLDIASEFSITPSIRWDVRVRVPVTIRNPATFQRIEVIGNSWVCFRDLEIRMSHQFLNSQFANLRAFQKLT